MQAKRKSGARVWNRILNRIMGIGLVSGLGLALAAPAPANAEKFPEKTVRIVVPFSAGGGSDMVARMLAERLANLWGQPVIVENRPGAGGSLGAAHVAQAPGDGYTLLLSDASATTINPVIYPDLAWRASDLRPIIKAGTFAMVATVPQASGLHTLADALAADKRKPGSLNVASSGVGSSSHLTLELVNSMAGARLTHVPYKGGGQAVVDLVGGQVDMMFSGFNATLMELIRSGKLRAIAVSTADRIAALPQVPTFAESGLEGVDLVSAQSVFAPATLPEERMLQLNQALNDILQSPELRTHWANTGFLPFQAQSLDEVQAWFAQESARWENLIRAQNIALD